MVVHILEIRRHFLGDDADVATQERVDDLAHRQHDSAQSDQTLTQRKATSLHIRRPRRALEQQVFKLLDLVVESLHGVEMPVDDVIDQAVEQEPNSVPGEVYRFIPTDDDVVQVERIVLSNGHQRCCRYESGELVKLELAGGSVQSHAVHAEELVICIAVELGALPRFQGVFDRERMETKFFCDVIQVSRLGPAQIDPPTQMCPDH
jgi:hypothetical protein